MKNLIVVWNGLDLIGLVITAIILLTIVLFVSIIYVKDFIDRKKLKKPVDNRITLKQFIERFVLKNTLIRLHNQVEGGHIEVLEPTMEWELLKKSISSKKVIGVTDILYLSHYKEAVNIVIEP